MNDLAIFEEAVRLFKEAVPFVLVTVIESKGSTPRKTGAKMIVRGDGSTLGTIGGGKVELDVIEAARAAMHKGMPETLAVSLTEDEGHVCGGNLRLYLEPQGVMPHLVIFGAGHVGRALATVARFAGFRVTAADGRAGFARKDAVPDADEIHLGDSGTILAGLPVSPNTYIVIATPDYESDFAAVRAALETSAGYIGVIGSRRKREALFKELKGDGYQEKDLSRVVIPVGLPIGGDSPEEIAVSIVAQMIQRRTGGGP